MTSYVTSYNQDFRYTRSGAYRDRNAVPVSNNFFRKPAKPALRTGKVCIACGIVRSVSNRCDCNS